MCRSDHSPVLKKYVWTVRTVASTVFKCMFHTHMPNKTFDGHHAWNLNNKIFPADNTVSLINANLCARSSCTSLTTRRVSFSWWDVVWLYILWAVQDIKHRVGQNHIYTLHIRYFWQGNLPIYGRAQCIYTVLANPKHVSNPDPCR